MAPVSRRYPSSGTRSASELRRAAGGAVFRPPLRLAAVLVAVLFAVAVGAGCSDDTESDGNGSDGNGRSTQPEDTSTQQEEQADSPTEQEESTTSSSEPAGDDAFGYPLEVPGGSGLTLEEAAALPVDDPEAFCERALEVYGTEALNNVAYALSEMEAMAALVPEALLPDHELVVLGLRADVDVTDPESPNGQAAAGFLERGREEVLAARARLIANAGAICGEDVVSGPPPELSEEQGGGDRDEGPLPDPPPGGFAPE